MRGKERRSDWLLFLRAQEEKSLPVTEFLLSGTERKFDRGNRRVPAGDTSVDCVQRSRASFNAAETHVTTAVFKRVNGDTVVSRRRPVPTAITNLHGLRLFIPRAMHRDSILITPTLKRVEGVNRFLSPRGEIPTDRLSRDPSCGGFREK